MALSSYGDPVESLEDEKQFLQDSEVFLRVFWIQSGERPHDLSFKFSFP